MNAVRNLKISVCVRFIGVMEVALFLSVIFPVMGFFGKTYWLFDLFSHFRLQYIAYFVVAGLVFFFLKRMRVFLFCCVMTLVLAAPLWPYYFSGKSAAHEKPIKVISFNVNSANTNFAGIRKFLISENADVVLLLELSPAMLRETEELHTRYPYRIEEPRLDNFGIAVFSKHPFRSREVHSFGDSEIPYVEFEVAIDGGSYRFFGVHTLPPVGAAASAARNDELHEISRAMRARHDESVIMMGDFNMSAFSPWFAEILGNTGVKDSACGFGISLTWMRSSWVFAIPIDQMLISAPLDVLTRSIGNDYGSDHNPLIVEVAKRK
ncbi:MAG: endonuclease/exonuclease/phosphatase family protein [Chthoniobacterales bacterium]